MVAPPAIRPCTPAELPALIGLLDAEFIVSRGRSVSLAQRFPAVLHADNCTNILLACRGGDIAAAIVIKPFDWIAAERSWRGAMIGMVYTRPSERGQGLASQLLRAAAQRLRADRLDFAVLWTAQPDFYRRLGWMSSDCGVLGRFASNGGTSAGCLRVGAGAVEALRLLDAIAYTPRGETNYRTLPLPAERLEVRASPCGAAYAIYGVTADRAYVYEFAGAPSGYAALWQEICALVRTIYVNERRGSAAEQWLMAHTDTAWRGQALAMWLPLAEPACSRHWAGWHVPFLDRI
jgi:predicted N-acetyltransferase YhbS